MCATNTKKLLSIAITSAIGVGIVGQAYADPILSIKIEDVWDSQTGINAKFNTIGGVSGTDGSAGRFGFNIGTTSHWTGDTGTDMLWGGVNQGPGSFSTGFLFAGITFEPMTSFTVGFPNGGSVGDITSGVLTVSNLDFGGLFGGGTEFYLAPDAGTLKTNFINDLGGGEFELAFSWTHYITSAEDPSGSYVGFTARWIIEGTATIEDLPPQITLNGVNPITIPPNVPYIDPDATCFDTVDGDLTASITRLLDGAPVASCDIANPLLGSVHTCEYMCQDSQLQNAVPVTRTINAGADTTPPVVTMLVGPPEIGRNDTLDGSGVDILVGVTYIDASATCTDDLDGNIPLGSPGFSVTPTPPVVDTSTPGSTDITFSCTDSEGNGPTVALRTVNVIADDIPPTLVLGGSDTVNVSLGGIFTPNQPPSTCLDTNPIDPDPVDISGNVVFAPSNVDTSVEGTTVIQYDCMDSSGNSAEPVFQTVNVVSGQNFEIISLTISDMDDDGLAGCFKFNSLNSATCASANQFSSDGSVTGIFVGPNETIPGMGTDLDENGDPIGIRFGVFQDVKLISPGFLFTGFPFEPVTFDPPSESAQPPSGTVTVTGNNATLVLDSMPFGGLFTSNKPNKFFLDPDPGTLNTEITAINDDDDGNTRTFDYLASWSHVITSEEDPTGTFVTFNAFWRIEGQVTVNSVPVTINNPPQIHSIISSQGDMDSTRIIVTDDGEVKIEVAATDPDGDTLSFDWSDTDDRIEPIGGFNNSVLKFDPDRLPSGIYSFRVTVTDDASVPSSSMGELLLKITRSAPKLGSGDSDGDGIPDDVEGFGDSDFDGLPNYHDAIDGTVDSVRNRVDWEQINAGDIVSDMGLVELGNVAFSSGGDVFVVTENEIGKYGGSGAESVTNSDDRLNRVDGIGHSGGGILDWKVRNIDVGSVACVVLPQAVPLPEAPIYRKYKEENGWADFVSTATDTLDSSEIVGGVCPEPTSALYQGGMSQGDNCVRVCIIDGGVNDADNLRNGIISDPGTVAGNGPVPVSDPSGGGGCSLSSEQASSAKYADWWLIAFLITGLGYFNRRHKLQDRARKD